MSRAIWLASYPKSGNTWMRLALKSLLNEGASVELDDILGFGEVPTKRELFDTELETESAHMSPDEIDVLRPDLHDLRYGDDGRPIVCKVHDMWRRVNGGRALFDGSHTHRTLYLIRDPRDVAVSWARFSGLSIDKAIAFMAEPLASLAVSRKRIDSNITQRLGSWTDHAESWLDQSGLEPHLVRYEDMLADLPQVLAAIANYLGWPHQPEMLDGADKATRFERLADQEQRQGFRERPSSAERFFVSGVAGGWRTKLSDAQVQRIEHDHGAVMRRFGYL
jgi:aryl sulfotransferase